MAKLVVAGWAYVLCGGALIWGCASSGEGGDGGGTTASGGATASGSSSKPIPVQDLCPVFTSDLCLYLRECNGARYRDQAHCERELDCFGLPALLAAVERGAVDYDPSKVGECHTRFVESPCTFGAFIFTPDIYEVLAYCPGTITPKLGENEACSSSGECAAGLYCLHDERRCPGTCRRLAVEGESCAGYARCAADLDCGEQEVCVPEAKPGDACTFSCDYSLSCPKGEICPENLWCDQELDQCQPGRLEGEACGRMGSGFDAFIAECAVHLWCDALEGQAGVCRKSSSLGGPCNDQRDACTEGYYCSGYEPYATAPALGTCSAPAAAGGHCLDDENCQSGLVCNAGECMPPAVANAACESSRDCGSGLVCTDLVCTTARYPGDQCADDGSCTFGRCVDGSCDYHARVGEACASGDDCATGECSQGLCFDDSICDPP